MTRHEWFLVVVYVSVVLGAILGFVIAARADVILIVNGTAFGPIEQLCGDLPREPALPRQCETVEAACARALKEIGAKYHERDQIWYRPRSGEVQCIPAPSGLRR